jgi:hypothetical protein
VERYRADEGNAGVDSPTAVMGRLGGCRRSAGDPEMTGWLLDFRDGAPRIHEVRR